MFSPHSTTYNVCRGFVSPTRWMPGLSPWCKVGLAQSTIEVARARGLHARMLPCRLYSLGRLLSPGLVPSHPSITTRDTGNLGVFLRWAVAQRARSTPGIAVMTVTHTPSNRTATQCFSFHPRAWSERLPLPCHSVPCRCIGNGSSFLAARFPPIAIRDIGRRHCTVRCPRGPRTALFCG